MRSPKSRCCGPLSLTVKKRGVSHPSFPPKRIRANKLRELRTQDKLCSTGEKLPREQPKRWRRGSAAPAPASRSSPQNLQQLSSGTILLPTLPNDKTNNLGMHLTSLSDGKQSASSGVSASEAARLGRGFWVSALTQQQARPRRQLRGPKEGFPCEAGASCFLEWKGRRGTAELEAWDWCTWGFPDGAWGASHTYRLTEV